MNAKKYLLLISFLICAGALSARAEDPSAGAVQPVSSETFSRLSRLKEENPEEFQRLIQERKAQIKSKVQEFRQKNPEKFEGFRKQMSEKRISRLKKMKQENPENFQRDMQGRAERFQRMKQENPQGFQKFMDNHPKFNARMNRRDFQHNGQIPGQEAGSPHSQNRENLQGKRENFKERIERREERVQEHQAGQGGSQFVSRPDLRKNSGEFSGQNTSLQREEFSQNHPRGRAQMESRQALNPGVSGSGPLNGSVYGKHFQDTDRSVAGENNFQGKRPEKGGEMRPFQRGAADRGQQGLNGGGQGAQSRRGGTGDGSRRRGH